MKKINLIILAFLILNIGFSKKYDYTGNYSEGMAVVKKDKKY